MGMIEADDSQLAMTEWAAPSRSSACFMLSPKLRDRMTEEG
jgi:hypothetical protein